ncbi:response regulator [Compostibacillus humi]|uniref:response regulator n=1 Tax=Compostibacillus humi TaxID=1245525 RepID=UPI00166BB4CA|nr:response regulator [Compostibacillus humi]
MKIRTQMLLVLSTLPILLFLFIGMESRQMAGFQKVSNTLMKNYELTILSEEIQLNLKDNAIYLRNLILTPEQEGMEKEINKIDALSEEIDDQMSKLESFSYTEEQNELVKHVVRQYEQYTAYKEEIIQHVLDGNREEARTKLEAYSQEMQEVFYSSLTEMTDTFEDDTTALMENEEKTYARNFWTEVIVLGAVIIGIFLMFFRNVHVFTSRLKKITSTMNAIASGKMGLDTGIEIKGNDELDEVATSFNQMSQSLKKEQEREQEEGWVKTHIAEITKSMSGQKTPDALAETFLSEIVPLVEGSHAVFYIAEESQEEEPIYTLRASYAFKERKHMKTVFRLGEGLVGQCAYEKKPIILANVPRDYIAIQSGLGEAPPCFLYLLPVIHEGEVKGIIEIASFQPFEDKEQRLLEELVSNLGITLDNVIGRIKQAKLLEETQTLMEEIQTQSEELQTQQEELIAKNEELEKQTNVLRQSEERLKVQQEELEQANVELEEKTNSLEEQNKRFEEKNKELEQIKTELEQKAKELALSSKYKTEFLANMSHELRTPLNSMLILSKLLSENKEQTLSSKQVEYAKTIYSSGKDLLMLINDILDLSKIESGKMDIYPTDVAIDEIIEFAESSFQPVADEKNVRFRIMKEADLPETIYTDETKLQQVLKNLLANAFKFTEEGEVTLEIKRKGPHFAFVVADTGIGIAEEHLNTIFSAFHQADGTTSRKYGGTGLGLSISKELSELLGGWIEVESELGKGSTFTFYVGNFRHNSCLEEAAAGLDNEVQPEVTETIKEDTRKEAKQAMPEENSHIKRLLIVDDDRTQRNSMMELLGDMNVIMKAVSTGKEAMEELKRNSYDCLVLDLGLTDTTGFDLLEKLTEQEKYDHLKVFVYTGRDVTSDEERFLEKHADSIIIKDEHAPARLKKEIALYLDGITLQTTPKNNDTEVRNNDKLEGKHILIADDDVRNVYALSSILEQYGIQISFAENGKEAINVLTGNPSIDLVVMDIMMPELDGYGAIQQIRAMDEYKNLPIIALTAKAMKGDREKSLEIGASDYIVKPVDIDQFMSLIKVWLFKKEGKSDA